MTVMKDSVESATPVKEVNYPEPPKGRADIGLSTTKRKLRPVTKTPSSGMSSKQRNLFSS